MVPPLVWECGAATVDVIVEPLSQAQSRLTISVDFEGHGIGKVLVPLMVRREARAEMPANMAALKDRLQIPKPIITEAQRTAPRLDDGPTGTVA
jgi:hypothetical protein